MIHFLGARYDSTAAPPEVYVMACSLLMDWVLHRTRHVGLTVLVYVGHIDDGKNEPNRQTDTSFLKLFIKTLGDNYPERLKRFVVYPFPWYGRAIWSVLKVFIDKRTQDKISLLAYDMGYGTASSDHGLPKELLNFVDEDQIPTICGGKDKRRIFNARNIILS